MRTRTTVFLAAWLFTNAWVAAEAIYPQAGQAGTHRDYTSGGTKAGVGSASYDYWISDGPWKAPPRSGFGDQSADNEGAVLLAFNPYTGEVFTEIEGADQYFNPRSSYSGGGHSSLNSAAEFASNGGIYPTASTNPMPAGAIFEDTIAFTTELRPNGAGAWVVGMYAQASADGAILGSVDPGHAGITTYNPHFLKTGETVGSEGSFDGADIRVYCGYIGWGGAAWMGQFGGAGERGIGFEIDGHRGWARIAVSGDRAGLILREYYFEGVDFQRPAEDYQFAVSSDDGGKTLAFSWRSFPGESYSVVHTTDPGANPDAASWPVVASLQGLPAESPRNQHVLARPSGPRNFYALVAGPAPPLFFDDFESGSGEWVSVINDPGGATSWELGRPRGSTGPLTGAEESTSAWSTNLGDYGPDSDISLRSPLIDLREVQAAKLVFAAYRDADGIGDRAQIRFLKASDLVQLGPVIGLEMDIFDDRYVRQSVDVNKEAMGQQMIIEFRFISDSSADMYSGLTIDNVLVEAQGEN